MVSRKQRKNLGRRRNPRRVTDTVQLVINQVQRSLSDPIIIALIALCFYITKETGTLVTKINEKLKDKPQLKWLNDTITAERDKIPHAAWGATLIYAANPNKNIGISIGYVIAILVFEKNEFTDAVLQIISIALLSAPIGRRGKALVLIIMVVLMFSGHLLVNIFK